MYRGGWLFRFCPSIYDSGNIGQSNNLSDRSMRFLSWIRPAHWANIWRGPMRACSIDLRLSLSRVVFWAFFRKVKCHQRKDLIAIGCKLFCLRWNILIPLIFTLESQRSWLVSGDFGENSKKTAEFPPVNTFPNYLNLGLRRVQNPNRIFTTVKNTRSVWRVH